jgi:hypothetical protein
MSKQATTIAEARGRATLAGLVDEARMNNLERDYRDYLATLLVAGLIARFDFEPEKLRIAGDFLTTYTPDFRVVHLDGAVEFHEVKGGHWPAKNRAKTKVAVHQHPYVFRLVRRPRRHGPWTWDTLSEGDGGWEETIHNGNV